MKKTKVFIIALTGLSIAATFLLNMTGCKKETVYSCNPELNRWAVQSLEADGTISRNDLAAYMSIDSQFALYRTLSAEEKCNVWKEKLVQVLQNYELTDAEKEHIQMAYDHLQPGMWANADSIQTLAAWSAAWQQQAVNKFGWDKTKTLLIAETWMTQTELHEMYERQMAGGGGPQNPPPSPDCTCSYSIYCSLSGNGTCNDGGCGTAGGCGLFGTSNCSGTCG